MKLKTKKGTLKTVNTFKSCRETKSTESVALDVRESPFSGEENQIIIV